MRICTLITLCSVLLSAAIFDNCSGRIPNRLFLTGMVLAGVCRFLEPAESGIAEAAPGICILCILLLFHVAHRIGGGDLKMFLFLQVLLPGGEAVLVFWLSLVYSGIAGIIGYFRYGNHSVRMGAGMFLGAVTAIVGGYL